MPLDDPQRAGRAEDGHEELADEPNDRVCSEAEGRHHPANPLSVLMTRRPTILVFDSGLGGLTVFREVVKARPDASFVYVADDACFPYARHGETELVGRVVPLMADLIATHAPDLVVIACNTASTLVLPELRTHFTVPFVGTVPAVKPACLASRSRLVSVLGTEATVRREYTRALIRDFGQGCDVRLVGAAHLAAIAEAALRDEAVEDDAIAREIAPCFVTATDGRRTDTVVLACTHYPLLLDWLERLAPWPVAWIDPAPAIARRMTDLIGTPAIDARYGAARITFTSGKTPPPALAAALAQFGLAAAYVAQMRL
jgi:glutamate racemase